MLNNPEDLYKIKVDSIENFEKILINKTLNDLEKLPNSPIDKFKNKEVKNEKKINKNKFKKEEKRSLIDNSKVDNKNETFSLLNDVNKKENFRFLNKLADNDKNFNLLHFRQKFTEKEINEDAPKKNIINKEILSYTKVNNVKNSSGSFLDNNIKKYYSQNQKILNKLNLNLTNLDLKILGYKKIPYIQNNFVLKNKTHKISDLKSNIKSKFIFSYQIF